MDDPALIPRAKSLLEQMEGLVPKDATEAETKTRMMRLLAVIDDPDALRQRSVGLLNTEETEQ